LKLNGINNLELNKMETKTTRTKCIGFFYNEIAILQYYNSEIVIQIRADFDKIPKKEHLKNVKKHFRILDFLHSNFETHVIPLPGVNYPKEPPNRNVFIWIKNIYFLTKMGALKNDEYNGILIKYLYVPNE
jgi:hypothetical protein